ncbi:MAG: hypothetical protein IPH06_03580 [Alphaproteobacteria bacterium]|jgi:hypothetical protein|nr:hypothetical protein [Alphaproteobacteria bacterium]QQS57123.1 MAG: hypothetical protein IPN28_12855 [Alphaproteobacteria bacterium]
MFIHTEISKTSSLKKNFSNPESVQSNILDLIRNFANFASLLRVCGALIMLIAMSTYLMQGWSHGNDISRYYMLLSQTFLLAVGGLGLSFLLKENKGARVFFGLGLISISVNMTTLGALIFSTTQWGGGLGQYPSFAKWVAPEFDALMVTLLATLAISVPVAWVSHKVLARRSVQTLCGLFLFTNLLLLLPVRESVYVGVTTMIAVTLPLTLLFKRMSQDSTLRTPEGLFAMATVFVPAGILLCRSLWLYPVDEIQQITLAGTAYIALYFCAQQTEEASFARRVINLLSFGAVLGVALPAAMLADRYLSGALAINVFGIIFAGFMLHISARCQNPTRLIRLALIVLAVCHIRPVLSTEDMSNAVLCIVSGLTIIAVSRRHGFRDLMVMGGVTVLVGVGRQILELVQLIDLSNWVTLSVLGGAIIIIASLFERHGAFIKMKWDRLVQPATNEHE